VPESASVGNVRMGDAKTEECLYWTSDAFLFADRWGSPKVKMPFRAVRPTRTPGGKKKRVMAFDESGRLSNVGGKKA
jgi:hypothetical protein